MTTPEPRAPLTAEEMRWTWHNEALQFSLPGKPIGCHDHAIGVYRDESICTVYFRHARVVTNDGSDADVRPYIFEGNPETILILTDYDYLRSDPRRSPVWDWIERVHEYESATTSPASTVT